MSSVPKLLFVSPVFPDLTGFGLAMRAGAVLEGLSTLSQVHLLIVPIQDPRRTTLSPRIGLWSAQQRVIRLTRLRRCLLRIGGLLSKPRSPHEWRFASVRTVHQAALAFQGIEFDYIHVFRLYMTPFAEPYLRSQKHLKARFLDLDDLESVTRQRLANLYQANGLHFRARREQQASESYARIERQLLPQFDVIFVCSGQDKQQLKARGLEQNVFVLPNVVRPPSALRRSNNGGPFNFLFVGNLAYYPNEDALIYFMERVLPLLRQKAKRPFYLTVVGAGHGKRLQRYRSTPELRIAGFVSDVAPYYDDADAAIVPLRAGGGTRIKVLEAFGFRRPVVSTPIGVEGLDVENEKQVLIAEDPAGFAGQCCRLMDDGRL